MEGGDTFSVHGNGNQVDDKAFHAVQKSFVQVQSILNQNRLLINEINQNHETMIPEELNNNIRRVVDLYADLSLSFAGPTEASSGGDSGGKLGHKRVRHVNES
ncbi:hypothetical protein MUK42_37092 [Musa troglodytarum]|uniref:Protein EARLY FLOWERING 4 domain-containing protein n=1 Tax=Musa troglodytarum TaxID=320322 RepID=A0A9E7HFH6_9LILI|nr:hypothetical protein MUK42_15571 [Musa troglodytarum]URE36425.1 hypothetical protein MUK42_37092 [Musa troglodytarum]